MKKLWNIVSFMAVVNLLSLIVFAGWLWQSGRLDRGRLLALKDLLAMTIAEEEQVNAEAAAIETEAAEDAAEKRRLADPPLPSSAQVMRTQLVNDQTQQALRRLANQTGQHHAELDRRSKRLEDREERLQERMTKWEESIREQAERRVDIQFNKTVKLYESLPGKQAKQMLMNLVAQDELRQAVAYIDAMSPRAAAKVIKELKTAPESKLATELLERLRIFGIEAETTERPSDADPSSTAQQPDALEPAGS